MVARLLLAVLLITCGLVPFSELRSANAQEGLVRSQTEAVQEAVQNQLWENARPDGVEHCWAQRSGTGRGSAARHQQSRYVEGPPRAAVK
jgi:hypothetical protein